jgi:hypothetical protein
MTFKRSGLIFEENGPDPKKYSVESCIEAVAMRDAGAKLREIGDHFGVGRQYAHYIVKMGREYLELESNPIPKGSHRLLSGRAKNCIDRVAAELSEPPKGDDIFPDQFVCWIGPKEFRKMVGVGPIVVSEVNNWAEQYGEIWI